MAGAGWQSPGDIEAYAQLRREPRRFSLFALLRLLERLDARRPRVGEARRPADEWVRLAQPPYLNFASSEVATVESSSSGRLRVEQFGFGVFGPNGVLPYHLTEFAFERSRHHQDPAVSDFINCFQHRLTELFYRAWAESDPVASQARPDDDRFREFIGALVGLAEESAQSRDHVHDYAKLCRAGLLSPSARSAENLQALLADYFKLPVRVREFVGGWLSVPPEQYTRLGVADGSAILGQSATLGPDSWQCQDRFEVVVGPLPFETFMQLLPGSRALEAMSSLVRFFTSDEWSWHVRLLVRDGDAPGSRLGQVGRLGWTSWLGTKTGVADDVVLQA